MADVTRSNADRGNIMMARQPLVDVDGKVKAYELLYRNEYTNYAAVLNDEQATSRVMMNVINHLGVEKVLGKKKGILNFNEQLFIDKSYEILDPKKFMIEILGHTILDDDSIEAIKAAASRGYMLGIDDFDFDEEMIERFQPIMPYIKFIKVDCRTTPMIILKQKKQFMQNLPVHWIAEKVEDVAQFEELKEFGFLYYQGYFFAKPELFEEKDVEAHLMAVMELLRLVNADEEFEVIESEFKKHPNVSVGLLKMINSASIGIRTEIQSIKQALTLIGHRKLSKWLTLMMYTKPGGAESDLVVLESAAWRGNLMEKIILAENKAAPEMAYFTGILSQLKGIYQIPNDVLLPKLNIDPEVQKAIIEYEGHLGKVLDLVEHVEELNTKDLSEKIKELKIPPEEFHKLVRESYEWVVENLSGMGED
jgi:EAL and modified HD-GYP domain-containing signal transduction protein